jgi:diguanylate cyclase (GGDEF)-like protein
LLLAAIGDAESCERHLKRAGLSFNMRLVDTLAAFKEALSEYSPDVVISDYTLSGEFDGLTALAYTRSKLGELPFVFVSEPVGEERAVEAVKRGASDFVIKGGLQRLAPAVERGLEEARERSERRRTQQEFAHTRSQLEGILSSLSDVVWSYSLRERRLNYVNTSNEKTLSRAAVDFFIHTERWLDVIHPQDREHVEREWNRAEATGKFDSTYRIVLPRGKVCWIHDRGAVVRDANGKPERVDGIARDITQFKLQEQRIERLNRVYAVLSGINTAIVRIRDRQELLQEACRIAVEEGGFGIAWIGIYDPDRLEITPIASAGLDEQDALRATKLILSDDTPQARGLIARMIAERRPMYCNDITVEPGVGGERRAEAIRRGYRSVIALPLLVEGALIGNLSLFAKEPDFFNEDELKLLTELADDVSFALDHIAKEEKLNYLAYFSATTGLPNRALFRDRLEQLVTAAHRDQKFVAVMMLDIERFRHINDTLGRQAGDDLLRQLPHRLKMALDETDILAHFGGDYFAVAWQSLEEGESIGHLLDQILTNVSGEPYRLAGEELRIASRAGIALYPADGADADSLLKNAEAALKDAKAKGHRYQFYAPQMHTRVAEELKLENDLRRAVLENQFVLYYQPRVDLTDGRCIGLEALIRWMHPERGLVSPGEFISILESTGLILEVGQWALKCAARDHAALRAGGLTPPRIAVNVSPMQLRRREFVDDVRAAVVEVDGSRGYIDIEITESMLVEDLDGNIAKLSAIGKLGMHIAVDDFGTGYSSLSYLSKLPIHSLKIDRSFISQMPRGPTEMAIVSTVISLGRALNLKVVAEGVETEEQANLLRLLRCDEAQGYLFSRPEPMAQLVAALRKT